MGREIGVSLSQQGHGSPPPSTSSLPGCGQGSWAMCGIYVAQQLRASDGRNRTLGSASLPASAYLSCSSTGIRTGNEMSGRVWAKDATWCHLKGLRLPGHHGGHGSWMSTWTARLQTSWPDCFGSLAPQHSQPLRWSQCSSEPHMSPIGHAQGLRPARAPRRALDPSVQFTMSSRHEHRSLSTPPVYTGFGFLDMTWSCCDSWV